LGNLDLTEIGTRGKSVYFTIGRFVVARYPSWLALPLALLAAISCLIAVWRQRAPLATLKGAGLTLAAAALSMVIAAGLWTPLGGWRSSMGVEEGYVYLALLALLTLAVSWVLARLPRRRASVASSRLGVVGTFSVLAVLAGVFVPGASYLFTWPALLGSLLLQRDPKRAGNAIWKHVRLCLVSAVATVLLVPAIDFLFQFANPRPGNPDSQVLAMIAVPALLISLESELLRAFWPRVREA
jgi:hypothetical protein